MSMHVSVFSTHIGSTILFSYLSLICLLYHSVPRSYWKCRAFWRIQEQTHQAQSQFHLATQRKSRVEKIPIWWRVCSAIQPYTSLLVVFQGWRHSPDAIMIYDCWTAPWSLLHPARTAFGQLQDQRVERSRSMGIRANEDWTSLWIYVLG